MFVVLKGVIKNTQVKDIAEIIIINYVEVKKKENSDIKSMTNNLNAAKNILKEGLKIISSGTGDYTDGDGVRSSNTQLSAKSEAHLSLANG